jgi:DNA-directed RNA polymerase subunit M/transcription elongation factor TFIIS
MHKYGNTEEEYRSAAAASKSIAEMCRLLGVRPVGSNYKTMKKKIHDYSIDVSHFLGQASNLGKKIVYSPTTNKVIKGRLVEIRGHECERCKLSEWLSVPITLELEHVDGDNSNNEHDNLKLLCPNCHSQTPTWRRWKTRSSDGLSDTTRCPVCKNKKNYRANVCKKCYINKNK